MSIVRSGAPATAVGSLSLLFEALTSPEVVTVAEFVTDGNAATAASTVSVNFELSPAAMGILSCAVMFCPARLIDQGAPESVA